MPKQKATNNEEFGLAKKCQICERPANGRHYNIFSCYRCKTYYRRAVLQRQTTECILKELCTNPKKLCRGCRYKKCINMGMSIKALQPRRDIIGVIRRPTTENAAESDLSDIEKHNIGLINRMTKLDNAIRSKKFDVINSKKAAKRLAEELMGKKKGNQCEDELQLMAKADVSLATQVDLLAMIEWTRTIPEFTEFTLNDRIFIIKRFASQYLTLENGFFTSLQNRKNKENIYQICNGSYMPRELSMIPDKNSLPTARLWRQEKLWKNMVASIIDEVINPLKLLKLLPQELLTLKLIILFNCGNHSREKDNTLPISIESRRMMIESKNRIISALFSFYKAKDFPNYPERFGNILLTISGILSAANILLETYQIMRLFDFAQFDPLSEQILFNTDSSIDQLFE